MADDKWTDEKTISIDDAVKRIGMKKTVLQYYIATGEIESVDNRILLAVCDDIAEKRAKYIGLNEYIRTHNEKAFDASKSQNRAKYIDYLEYEDYFGIEPVTSEGMYFLMPRDEELYLLKDDTEYIDFKSIPFFETFGFSEKQKIEKIISDNAIHPKTVKRFKEYTKMKDNGENNIYTPSYTEFADAVLSAEEVTAITDEDVASLVENATYEAAKSYIIEFYEWTSHKEKVKYHSISKKKKESGSIEAYSYEKYISLAMFLFSQTYDNDNNLTKKALSSHVYAELWLFLSIHYVCGWRAADICNCWVYLDLKDSNNPFKIDPEHIYDDITNNRIDDKTFTDIALYSIKKLELSFKMAHKTGKVAAGKLRSNITPELRLFFGRLILIAEYHHFTSGEGYMKSNRISLYCNWTRLRDFFGKEIIEVFGNNNISSRRLNKSYLQGIEETTRKEGETSLVAHIVASLARNHTNYKTIIAYLKDHGLTGESADVVLYMMMQRGVMSVYLYKALVMAFPEQFTKLTANEQTKIMEMIPVSPYELETAGVEVLSGEKLYLDFKNGETEEPLQILKAMYAIGQGHGKAKDDGIYCTLRALGQCCEHPTYKSCIAGMCPHNILTKEGIPAIIRVLKECEQKNDPTGKNKYQALLRTLYIPNFQQIINEFAREMNKADKQGFIAHIQEKLDE